jgi:uncharacterized protein (DUF2235 family)
MSRNHIICCDGTNNQFGPENTSVVRLAQVINRNPTNQRLYYDPGVGTLPEPGVFTAIGKRISEWFGLAFGTGLGAKVEGAYSYLMDFWEPGDRVFLFGFSRGAYTVRVLAGLLHTLGLLPRGNYNLVPYVMRLFAAVRSSATDSGGASAYWKLCDDFRWTFARQVPGAGDERRFKVHFMGIWDTVSSVGWVWDPVKFPFSARNPSIEIIRHAVSVDERRAFFRQNLVQPEPGQDVQELWFPGVHSDVGGGYPDTVKDGGLWRTPFDWILREAQKAGLLVDQQRLQRVLSKTPAPAKPWAEPQHNSLTPSWWPAEFFPKLRSLPGSSLRMPRMNLGRYRYIHDGALLHESTLLRIRAGAYAPPNIPNAFVKKVQTIGNVPAMMPFEAGSSGSISHQDQPCQGV